MLTVDYYDNNGHTVLVESAIYMAKLYLEDRLRWREDVIAVVKQNIEWFSKTYNTKDITLILEQIRKQQQDRIKWLHGQGLLS